MKESNLENTIESNEPKSLIQYMDSRTIYICVHRDDEEALNLLKKLRENGYFPRTAYSSGSFGFPIATLGSQTYFGFEEIEDNLIKKGSERIEKYEREKRILDKILTALDKTI